MNPTQYYVNVLKNYARFDGRARRAGYWYFVLFNTIVSIVLAIVGAVLKFPWLANLYSLAVVVPSIAVGIRRMHDVEKSGWFILIPFYNLYLSCIEGTRGPNSYGADPKASNAFQPVG
jgi:uncharacterized membrane protein YhaH (DUF805 family)